MIKIQTFIALILLVSCKGEVVKKDALIKESVDLIVKTYQTKRLHGIGV
jgi:hypothetical protein